MVANYNRGSRRCRSGHCEEITTESRASTLHKDIESRQWEAKTDSSILL